MPENDLRAYFRDNPGRLIHKWDHYFDVYDRHLSRYRGQAFTMIEIGVFHGGSLQMWKKYFGRKVRIVGVDVDPRVRPLGEKQVEIVVGDQTDRVFLQDLVRRTGPVDLVVDDGGHSMEQQITSLEELWPAVVDGGTYVVEDLHTSYWPGEQYGGGLRQEGTFIERTKDLVDRMHAWHVPDGALEPDAWTRSLRGLHVYDSVVVLDKADVQRPWDAKSGRPSYPMSTD